VLNRREFIGAATQAAAVPRRPNLLYIVADQWRAQTTPGAKDPNLIAPNLERLTREGIHFSRCYASNPVCTPSRAAMQTGKFSHACNMPHNDLLLPLEERTIAAELGKAGYRTGYIGKWHLDGEARPGFVPPGPRRRGYQYWAAFNRGHFYFKSTYYRDSPEPIPHEGFEPDYQTSLAMDFIESNKSEPWYMFLSWGPPHTPRTPPARTKDLYKPKNFTLRENVPFSYQEKARIGHAGYCGLCTALDENIGLLLKKLDALGLAEDTIVIFTSDHGDMLGSQGLEYKGVPYEESCGIPFIMRYPRKLKGGEARDMLMSNVDHMPTLLSMCGVVPPSTVQGRDLSELILTGKGEEPSSIYAEGRMNSVNEWRMVVRGYDKLVVNSKLKATHLYNLGQDPFEKENGALSPKFSRQRDELMALLNRWRFRTGDRVPYPVAKTDVEDQ
jgi:arylsulfatase A-like enzyme